jgi:hypothetical protein
MRDHLHDAEEGIISVAENDKPALVASSEPVGICEGWSVQEWNPEIDDPRKQVRHRTVNGRGIVGQLFSR